MLPIRPWKRVSLKFRSPLAWLFILILVSANLATFMTLWSLLSSQGQASASRLLPGNGSPALLLPESTLAPEPTATATQVAIYAATATSTPPPTATPSPTVTSPPPATAVATATATGVPAQADINHVLIISIDGLRPDALDQADTPILDKLRAQGAYSPQAQTVSLSITLPGHASMLTGMTPDKHGIQWGLPYIGWPGMNGPSLFSVANAAGLSTAMIFGKEKMNHLVLPDSVDTLFGTDVDDPQIRDQALEVIQDGLPNVLFVHFPDTDRIGHAYGWMSRNQLHAINFVDGLIGDIVATLEQEGYRQRTLLIITADHGGHGKSHGDDSPEDRTIPWLAVGPGVPPVKTLTGPVNIYDTAATAAYALRLPLPEIWDGQPLLEIFATED